MLPTTEKPPIEQPPCCWKDCAPFTESKRTVTFVSVSPLVLQMKVVVPPETTPHVSPACGWEQAASKTSFSTSSPLMDERPKFV